MTNAPVEEALPSDPSIAVLPFADMSPDQDQGYFSDGISEELLNLLVRVDGLKVASRTSSFTYKGSNQSLAEIASELKVDHVLEGSVRKADNRMRITAQLIDARTDRHLWSESFDRELVDIFAIQDEIANAIVSRLKCRAWHPPGYPGHIGRHGHGEPGCLRVVSESPWSVPGPPATGREHRLI